MREDAKNFIAPQMLEKIILTDHEKMCIRKTQTLDRKSWLGLIAMIIFLMIVPVVSICFDWCIDGHITMKNLIETFIFLSPIWALLVLLIIGADLHARFGNLKYQGAARGTVVEMSVIYQIVHQKSNGELMPYQRPGMPEYRDKPASYYSNMKEQPFYYLTVQIENSDQQIRYVNCHKVDFDALKIGRKVLVVYYGNASVIGYITD